MADGHADVFITYCTNSAIAVREQPQLQVLTVAAPINLAATYDLAVLNPASDGGHWLAQHRLSPAGQKTLTAFGFSPP